MSNLLKIIEIIKKMFTKTTDNTDVAPKPVDDTIIVQPTRVTGFSENGLALVKKWEGLRLKPYLDGGGVATIGYGTTFYENGTKVTMKDKPITVDIAVSLLRIKLKSFADSILSLCSRELTQNQLDALCCFVYNVGVNGFKTSTMLKLINNPDSTVTEIADQFLRWDKDNGKVIEGLSRRRQSEREFWLNQD